jgi:hypothetical protein
MAVMQSGTSARSTQSAESEANPGWLEENADHRLTIFRIHSLDMCFAERMALELDPSGSLCPELHQEVRQRGFPNAK